MPDSVEDVVGDFIAKAPLYQRLDLKPYAADEFALINPLYEATPILHYCSHDKCKAERPFRRVTYQTGLGGHNSLYGHIFTLLYMCTHCDSQFWCWVEASEDELWMRKVGQLPPYDISVPPDLQSALGDDAALYKCAQICIRGLP